MKSFACEHCGKVFGKRVENTLISEIGEIQFKVSTAIKCPNCARFANFFIDNKRQKDKN